ncbi:MAG TPA: ABC transporter substrate-binding protein, partial [Acidimicrobiia bacterium]|nr:ABC transporter substrate-binding protein [Acidimicrobiia bacterium]
MRGLGRALVALIALASFAAATATEAQPPAKRPRVGVLLLGTPDTDPVLPSFRAGLRELGYVEGKDVVLEYRFAEGKPDRLPDLARDLVNAKPDMVFAFGGDVAPFARAATSTIPIVMVVSVDPVQAGLVASLARPGGNITGVTFVSSDLAAKRLQLLKEMSPAVARIGVLWNPDHVDPEYRETQAAGRTLGVEVHSLEVRQPADFERAFRTAATARVEAIVVVSSRLMSINRLLIA